MMRKTVALSICLAVAACDGPHEDAGERIDAERGETGGESSIIAGPAERRGEQLDRLAAEREKARRSNEARPN